MKATKIHLLASIARGDCAKTTAELGRELGVSQQTVSRWIKDLQADAFIEKTSAGLELTPAGKKTLAELASALETSSTSLEFIGTLFTGLRDGSYYLSQEGYCEQVRKQLGFDPFPGTLNLRLDDGHGLAARQGLEVKGFKKKDRVFGGAKLFRARVKGTACGVIVPERTHYAENVLEVISPHCLRKKLGLKDGDQVRVTVFLD